MKPREELLKILRGIVSTAFTAKGNEAVFDPKLNGYVVGFNSLHG